MSNSRDADRVRLEREICGAEYAGLLAELQRENAFLRQFATWDDVIAFAKTLPPEDLASDEILGPILRRHRSDKCHLWRSVLLVLFWNGLESIHARRRKWDRNDDQRWQNIVWAFFQGINGMDVEARGSRFFHKLYFETARRLYREYSREWKDASYETPTDPADLINLAPRTEDPEPGSGLASAREAVIARLRKHLELGHITETDFLLLVGTRVYEKSLSEYCNENGLSYQTMRQRRARLEQLLRKLKD